MNVKELMDLLEKCDPAAYVYVWDAYYDGPTFDVRVSVDNTDPHHVHVGATSFGVQVTPNLC